MAYSPWGDIPSGFGAKGFNAANGFPDDDSFDIGDIVSLIVGGPDMVVISVCECGTVEVAWSDSDGDVCVDAFPVEALVNPDDLD
jgi:uncharacterized protein YodC (DUF2158 family)